VCNVTDGLFKHAVDCNILAVDCHILAVGRNSDAVAAFNPASPRVKVRDG
jgi:hypothetical protein